MTTKTVSLAEAKAHLSALTELVARGETVLITKRGKPVVQVTRPATPRQPVALGKLRELTDSMPCQKDDAGDFMRNLRDGARY